MAKYKVINVTEQWLILNQMNVKIPPQSDSHDLIVDEAELQNPDIKELLAAEKVKIVAESEQPKKRGRKPKATGTKQKKQREGVGRPKSKKNPDDEPSTGIVVKEGVPTRKKFTTSAERTIFIDNKNPEPEDVVSDEYVPPDVVSEGAESRIIPRG